MASEVQSDLNFLINTILICGCSQIAGGKNKKNEMDRACGAYGRGESCAQGFGGEAGGKETIGETQT
jgi:hypothetical protein